MEEFCMTFEQMGEELDAIAETLPAEFFRDLNGGIFLEPEAKPDPHGGDLYILGCYYSGGTMGRYIAIYYGSFIKVYAGRAFPFVRRELRKTLIHEFRHHVESLSGERGLEIEDEIFLENYFAGHDKNGRPV